MRGYKILQCLNLNTDKKNRPGDLVFPDPIIIPQSLNFCIPFSLNPKKYKSSIPFQTLSIKCLIKMSHQIVTSKCFIKKSY